MTYPKATTGKPDEVPAGPRFPEIEERVRAYWDADGTFVASVQARPADGADGSPAATSSSSTTARRSPTACRTTATC